MADGHKCKFCGHYEAAHEDAGLLSFEEFVSVKPGYTSSLQDCRTSTGFTLNKADSAAVMRERKSEERDLLTQPFIGHSLEPIEMVLKIVG